MQIQSQIDDRAIFKLNSNTDTNQLGLAAAATRVNIVAASSHTCTSVSCTRPSGRTQPASVCSRLVRGFEGEDSLENELSVWFCIIKKRFVEAFACF